MPMPRAPRIIVPGIPHHVTQRGNHQTKLFYSPLFFHEYLEILKKQCDRTGLVIDGYCLMDNHIHLIATPPTEQSLSSAIGQAHHLYSQARNLHKKLNGHIWEKRFFSCPLDEAHFVNALVYVDMNPVKAGIVRKPRDWMWSSAVAHAGGKDIVGLIDPVRWGRLASKIGWSELPGVIRARSIEDDERLEFFTRTGRPMGDDKFLDKIEKILGYSVRRREKAGRPATNEG